MAVFDLPSSRTDRLTEGSAVRHARHADYAVADTPGRRLTNWGHRVIPAAPPWELDLARCFGWWVDEHGGKGVSKAYVGFEAEPWDAMTPLPAPPGAPMEANLARSLRELGAWRPLVGVELRSLSTDAEWAELLAFSAMVNGYDDDEGDQGYLRWSLAQRRGAVARGGIQLGAYSEGRLVGGAALLTDGREARYADVAVDGGFRNRGIATALVGTLARDLRAAHPTMPVWITATAGSQAERIYERLGFEARSTGWCWVMDAPLTEDEIRRRWARLRESSLSMDHWRHRDHLWAAVMTLREHGGDVLAAVTDLREVIKRFLLVLGVETTTESGYHETLTRGFLKVVAEQMRAQPRDSIAVASIRAQLAFSDKRYLLRHWNRDTMMSHEARHGWVPPDLELIGS